MTSAPFFTTSDPATPSKFGPRTGRIRLDRGDGSHVLDTETPALLIATSRGVVPHLTRDHVHLTTAIRHVQLPFESFLDRNPPVPTLVEGPHPLHSFLGYRPESHALILTLRDPSDGRKMPPNGTDFVSAQCTRGVRKASLAAWKEYAHKCSPDLVVALSDTPLTPPPHSQKRLTKSIERSIAWLAETLREPSPSRSRPPRVLVHLAGGASSPARAEFSDRLTERIELKDAAGLAPLDTLDDGVAGYVFDLLPLHMAILADSEQADAPNASLEDFVHVSDRQRSSPQSSERLVELLHASLSPLSAQKPRIVNSPVSPHEILRLVRDIGVDLIDSFWAQRAADIGIALDFAFPAPSPLQSAEVPPPRIREAEKLDLGHNLFDHAYAHDHSRLAATFLDGRAAQAGTELPVCPCGACSPQSPASRLLHSPVDHLAWADKPPATLQPPFVRSYIHHLLHTHEMSSHTLLTMHNMHVLDAFLAGIRAVLARPNGKEELDREIKIFERAYDEGMALWDEAERVWLEVERARGKGRLAREKEKQEASTIGTAVEL
ncbi:tRNA-guanine(15) transglycosylase-like protein [Epithele typhae]|uniref:tRNA-guanine(15) transglycosylase-like protein n=1 Tax=Epithele typhae TaxID=378194 RepID=UPI002008277F|nr:tRNA-guanine(15) transglycosylase-like protein [Epithele typhae]KAH9946347.1 tRNA-guanine(15) transglycosylase-like protein [Epithele typhae]